MRGVGGEDLADDQVVEEHAQGDEVLLDGGRGERGRELLNVGGDEEGRELLEGEAAGVAPDEEAAGG